MSNTSLLKDILVCSYSKPLPSGTPCTQISFADIQELATAHARSIRQVEILALANGILPTRYIRNYTEYSLGDQKKLLESQILIVGLGGLGGHVLDLLIRLGVGTVQGADGDMFEAHNLNRQLLSSEARIGVNKAKAASDHVRAVNNAVTFVAIPKYLTGDEMLHAMEKVDLVVDCLGGLEHRTELQEACKKQQKTMVSAAIGGYSGYVATVKPGEANPASFMGRGNAAEDVLGTPAPVVAFAASLQAKAVVDSLLGKPASQTIIFDMASGLVEHISM